MESGRNSKHSNPILVAQSVSRLVEKIRRKGSDATEIKHLKEKCINSEDEVISLAASKGLVLLVESGVLQIFTTLSELVSSLALAKSYEGIVTAICDLLLLDVEDKLKTTGHYKCAFNLRSPQHPLILLLDHRPDLWIDILSKLKYFYNKDRNKNAFYANELLYPFYMYVICNPRSGVPEIFQHKLWRFIIRLDDRSQSLNVFPYFLAWIQISTKSNISKVNDYLMDLCTHVSENNNELREVLVLWLASLLYELIQNKCDPRETIDYLINLIRTHTLRNSVSTILVLLSECVICCPSEYLYDLLKLCKQLILLNASNTFAIQAMKVSLLQWIAYECSLTSNSLQIAEEILLHIRNNQTCSNSTKQLYLNKLFNFLTSTNRRVHLAVELNVLSESSTSLAISDWLHKVNKLPTFLLKHLRIYFMALLLNADHNTEITIQTIEVLLRISKTQNEITTHLLTLILYKLARTTDSEVHFRLLKALPRMVVLKENLPLILNTLELVQSGRFGLKSFAMSLFFDLWSMDVKYYPHLQNVLVYGCDRNVEGPTRWWEFYVTKAFVLKQICTKSPQLYGKELVGHLSDVLNKCGEDKGDLASALALDGITELCKADIIDIASTWNELAPRFNGEQRVAVIRSLCNLMAEVSYLEQCSDEKLLNDVMEKLWNYALHHENIEVIKFAYNALACFGFEQISTYLPENLKKLPSHTSSQSDVLFDLVHGDCWINLLVACEDYALDSAGDLLIKLVSKEISEYRGGTYQIKENQREPLNFNYLPPHSIVRALGNYLRKLAQKWHDSLEKQAYLQCLRVLSREYDNPLPPADWSFLQELIHIPEARTFTVTLASHQVRLSGSARRLMENYIMALTEITTNTDNDVENIYRNLYHLCNSIQPMTLRPFLENSINSALKKLQNVPEETFLKTLLIYIGKTLRDEKLHEANRHVLSQIIVNLAQQVDVDDALFNNLLECIVFLPLRYVDQLSSPKLWKHDRSENLKLCVKIRCALALVTKDASPLKWLDDFINAASFMPLEHQYVLNSLAKVMELFRNSDLATTWILEFLGHIQSTIANENTSKTHLQYLCDVYIVSTVILSGQDIFSASLDDLTGKHEFRLRVFPQSVAYLMTTKYWEPHTAQIAEWLFFMTNYEETPQNYKVSFYQSLAALRHVKLFEQPSKWMKYLGMSIPLRF